MSIIQPDRRSATVAGDLFELEVLVGNGEPVFLLRKTERGRRQHSDHDEIPKQTHQCTSGKLIENFKQRKQMLPMLLFFIQNFHIHVLIPPEDPIQSGFDGGFTSARCNTVCASSPAWTVAKKAFSLS